MIFNKMVNKRIIAEIKNEDKECLVEEMLCANDIINRHGKLSNLQLERLKIVKELKSEIVFEYPDFLSLFNKIDNMRLESKND